jgi:hypothetical protein
MLPRSEQAANMWLETAQRELSEAVGLTSAFSVSGRSTNEN